MGGIFGGWLQRAGNDLMLVDISAASVEFINAHGLSIEEKDGSTTHVKATAEPAKVGQVDLIISLSAIVLKQL